MVLHRRHSRGLVQHAANSRLSDSEFSSALMAGKGSRVDVACAWPVDKTLSGACWLQAIQKMSLH